MSTSPVALASAREVRTRLRRPSFFVFTGLLVAAILASGILYQVLNDDSPPSYDVGTVGAIPDLFGPAIDVTSGQADITVTLRTFDDPADAQQALTDGDVDAVVDADIAFHEAVLRVVPQFHTVQIWHSIAPRIRVYFRRESLIRNLDSVVDEHRALLVALHDGDRKTVLETLEQHIKRVQTEGEPRP